MTIRRLAVVWNPDRNAAEIRQYGNRHRHGRAVRALLSTVRVRRDLLRSVADRLHDIADDLDRSDRQAGAK